MTPEMLGIVMVGVMVIFILLGGHVAATLGATGIIFALICRAIRSYFFIS